MSTPHRFQARDGACFVVSEHGAQLLSWQPAGGAVQLLVPTVDPAEGKSLRGGVPVVFPQFAAQGPLPRHGLVRTRDWQLVQRRDDDLAMAVLRFESDAQTLAQWPHAFALELTLLAQGRSLEIELAVQNTGETDFEFQAALHSYLRVGDVAQCMVEGLRDRRYVDSAQGREGVQHSSHL